MSESLLCQVVQFHLVPGHADVAHHFTSYSDEIPFFIQFIPQLGRDDETKSAGVLRLPAWTAD